MYGYIYLTKNKITGDTYVGQHSKPYFDNSYHGSGVNVRKQFAKYGVENFETTMIHAASSQEQLNKLEKETISHYRQQGDQQLHEVRKAMALIDDLEAVADKLPELPRDKEVNDDDQYSNCAVRILHAYDYSKVT